MTDCHEASTTSQYYQRGDLSQHESLEMLEESRPFLNEKDEIQLMNGQKRRWSRLYFVFVFLFALIFTITISFSKSKLDLNQSSNIAAYSIHDSCQPGIFGQFSQLKPFAWKIFDDTSEAFPIYWTHNLNEKNEEVKKAIIIQHGNLRNANDYFCAAVQSIQEIINHQLDHYMIIAPQFLVDKDLCWNDTINSYQEIDHQLDLTCNYFLWTSEGWKDGKSPVQLSEIEKEEKLPLEQQSAPNSFTKSSSKHTTSHYRKPTRTMMPIRSTDFYSYDIFNLLINQLAKIELFPNLEEIVLFGFSAGGQTLLRYSLYPNYNESLLTLEGNERQKKSTTTSQLGQDEQKEQGQNAEKDDSILSPLLKEQEILSEDTRIKIKSIVGDVSSYLYFDERRPFANQSEGFGVPSPDWILVWKVRHSIPLYLFFSY